MKTFLQKESLFKENPTSFLTLTKFKETIK